MILGAMAFAFWSASRAAAERAIRLGGDACRAAGVQLIDHTVHATGLRLRRGEDGRLGFERAFRFEYSEDGTDRHIARIVLHGDHVVSFSGPLMPAAGIVAQTRHIDRNADGRTLEGTPTEGGASDDGRNESGERARAALVDMSVGDRKMHD
jgi:hypothetical protein